MNSFTTLINNVKPIYDAFWARLKETIDKKDARSWGITIVSALVGFAAMYFGYSFAIAAIMGLAQIIGWFFALVLAGTFTAFAPLALGYYGAKFAGAGLNKLFPERELTDEQKATAMAEVLSA